MVFHTVHSVKINCFYIFSLVGFIKVTYWYGSALLCISFFASSIVSSHNNNVSFHKYISQSQIILPILLFVKRRTNISNALLPWLLRHLWKFYRFFLTKYYRNVKNSLLQLIIAEHLSKTWWRADCDEFIYLFINYLKPR